MRKFLAEFVGTFFLVLTVGIAVIKMSALAPLAIGGVLTVMVYAAGHVSGAHFNPAVTLAALVRGVISRVDAAGYVVAQAAAGVLAALAAGWITHPAPISTLTLSGRAIGVALLAECLFTFALAYVVLNVATSRDHPDNSFYGLAIGGTVMAGAATVGGISGGVFNPAVALGGAVLGLFAWSSIWVYLIAALVGGSAAGALFLALNPGDRPNARLDAGHQGVTNDPAPANV
ncbi:glycerol uptake facilitator protein [Actinoplanes sp. NBRC 14428]|uniref:Aquaporin Z n=1 Tax=Pseudosporangium ferrugineum TaxID=439699 RepID=A0A2T0RHG3_9ACTN|nr:aquaporin [Pseudosporangium ferrugineum]PRY20613.1 aquaporin Z [Pseudosporangium ferrugineum]BCJ51427.1 glycerol uptake facilitator protein [Actinoplanes sp. NBRC 14428]